MSNRSKVVFVYPHLPHYRRAVFARLVESLGRENVVFAADTHAREGTIRCIQRDESFDATWCETQSLFLGKLLLWQRGLCSCVIAHKPKVVVALGNAFEPTLWALAFLCRFLGVKLVWWTHGLYGAEGIPRRRLRMLFYWFADCVWVYGERAKRLLVQAGYNEDRIDVVYNSLDYDCQQACMSSVSEVEKAKFRELWGIPDGAAVVLFVGRLVLGKRLDLVGAAVLALRRRGKSVVGLFIGDGPERSVLEQMVAETGDRGGLVFVGGLYEERQIATAFACACVCASPANVGLTAIHSLGYGVPVVTSGDLNRQMPESEAIEDGVSGSFCEDLSIECFADAIEPWLTVQIDLCDRRRVSQSVHQYWNPVNQVRVMAGRLNQLVQNG